MRTIYKYPFQVDDEVWIALPYGAEILSVQKQGASPLGSLVLWALVDTDEPPEDRRLLIRGTGHEASSILSRRYVGSVQEQGGALVWHVFEDR